MNEERTDEEIRLLVKELARLQLEIGEVSKRLKNLQGSKSVTTATTVGHRRSKREKESGKKHPANSTETTKRDFKVGDRIWVRNPTSKQPVHTGEVTGYTKIGYIKFKLDDGIRTCRDKKNLELVKGVEY